VTLDTHLWFEPERAENEPDDSWIRRAASLYQLAPSKLIQHLEQQAGGSASKNRERLAKAEKAAKSSSLGSTASGPYCPLCFARDLHRERLPHFRRSWQNPWTTHCEVDRMPLLVWPYRDSAGDLFYPDWVAEAFLAGKARARTEQKDAQIRTHLVRVRGLRMQVSNAQGEALPWLQQLEQEDQLLCPDRAPVRAMLGLEPAMVRRVVADLSTLLGHNFGRSGRCQASDLAGFLGPSWLFGSSFASGRALPGHSTLCLASFVDPAQRRTLITLSMRLLTSFAADPEFANSGDVVDVGQTILSRELKNFPEPAKRWAQTRSGRWPRFVVIGMRGAMRCNSGSWAVPR
jgi:hypothetical protein